MLQPRWAMSLMLGPMTRNEIRRALGKEEKTFAASAAASSPDGQGEAVQEVEEEDEEDEEI